MHLRIRMGKVSTPNEFYQIIKLLQMVIGNIVKDPRDPKFQRLKLSNPKIK